MRSPLIGVQSFPLKVIVDVINCSGFKKPYDFIVGVEGEGGLPANTHALSII